MKGRAEHVLSLRGQGTQSVWGEEHTAALPAPSAHTHTHTPLANTHHMPTHTDRKSVV